MKDTWAIILLFLAVIEPGASVLNLLLSDDFDTKYDELIHIVKDIDADEMKNRLINYLGEFKDKAKTVNERYKELGDSNG